MALQKPKQALKHTQFFGLGALDEEQATRLINKLSAVAEPFRFLEYNEQNYIAEFGAHGSIQTPVGIVELDYVQLEKLLIKRRTRYFGLIKPTLQNPCVVVKLSTGRVHFIKTFIDRQEGVIHFVSIAQDETGWYDVRTNHERTYNQVLRTLQEGDIIYQISSITALDGAEPPPPTYAAPRFGLPFRLDAKIVKTGNQMKYTQFFGLGALDGLSKQELKTYKAILRDIRWAHEEIKEQYDFTGRDTDKLASHLAYKYGIPITSDELKTITIKFPNARYRFEADNIVRIANPMNVRYEKRNYHVNDERLALAKQRAIKLLTPLGDLPTVLNRDGYKVSFYSNEHEPPHVHVRGHGGSAIFKIAPVELRESSGYSLARLNKIRLILQENKQQLLEAWMSFFKK